MWYLRWMALLLLLVVVVPRLVAWCVTSWLARRHGLSLGLRKVGLRQLCGLHFQLDMTACKVKCSVDAIGFTFCGRRPISLYLTVDLITYSTERTKAT
eukprot:g49678.t1